MEITIRPAAEADSVALTDIAFAAKRHWNYPPEYIDKWRHELTITPAYIRANTVRVAEAGGRPVGFGALVRVEAGFRVGQTFVAKGYWLDHIFLLPAYIGRGIGSRLVADLTQQCRQRRIGKIHIFADPHARGFYDKLGAVYQGEFPSSIPGRTVPKYILEI
jgi:GNAT superfamily N-acetyltransferase